MGKAGCRLLSVRLMLRTVKRGSFRGRRRWFDRCDRRGRFGRRAGLRRHGLRRWLYAGRRTERTERVCAGESAQWVVERAIMRHEPSRG